MLQLHVQQCALAILLLTAGLPTQLLAPLLTVEASEQEQQRDLNSSPEDAAAGHEVPNFKIELEAVRDTIASLLREAATTASEGQGDDNGGYAEAAQEYIEHVQSLLSAVKSTSEIYVREQLADLETLDSLLSSLAECTSSSRGVGPRLINRLAKGPARQLLRPFLLGVEPATYMYTGSDLAVRIRDAVGELRRFLAAATVDMTGDLRRHSDSLPSGPIREYLDSVLDRVLQLEGKKTNFSVEFTGDGQEPKVTQLADQDDKEQQQSSTEEDTDGQALFDQVLGRRAAASVVAQLAKGGSEAAVVRIKELRWKRYQPAGMAVILETIEQCIKKSD